MYMYLPIKEKEMRDCVIYPLIYHKIHMDIANFGHMY